MNRYRAAAVALFLVVVSCQPPATAASSVGIECRGVPPTITPFATPFDVTQTPIPSKTPFKTATPTRVVPTKTPPPTVTPVPTACVTVQVEATLIMDMSTSMNRETRAGRAKYEAAIEAAGVLVDLLDIDGGDAMAIVGFNDKAWTAAQLGSNRSVLRSTLNALPDRIAEGTRLDLALIEGRDAANGYRHDPTRTAVAILLTDGLPNRVPFAPGERQEDTVLAAADAIKSRFVTVYTIGLGADGDVSDQLLRDVASGPSLYHRAPDGEDLEGIFRTIAEGVAVCGGLLEVSVLEHTSDPHKAASEPSPPVEERILVGPGASLSGVKAAVGDEGIVLDDELAPILARAGYVRVWTPGQTGSIPTALRGRLASGPYAARERVSEPLEPVTRIGGRIDASSSPDTTDAYRPFDPLFTAQWDLRIEHASDGWSSVWEEVKRLGATGAGLVIAVMDNGVDCRHPDLNCMPGMHFDGVTGRELTHLDYRNTEVVGDDHGTFVAGRCCSLTDNGLGIASSDVAVVNVTAGRGGRITESAEIAGSQWIYEQALAGVPIVASNHSYRFSTTRVCAGLDKLRAVGVMPFAAVGNDGNTRQYFPAGCPAAEGIGMTTITGRLSDSSQRSNVDLVIAGEGVWSTCKDSRGLAYGEGGGTSFAAPAAARDYAIIRHIVGDPERAIEILYETARKIVGMGYDSRFDGWGKIRLDEAVITARDEAVGIAFPSVTPELPTPGPATATSEVPIPEETDAWATVYALTGTPTPTGTPTLDPTVSALLTGTPPVPGTPTPELDPTVVALLTGTPTAEPTATVDATEVARRVCEIIGCPTADPDRATETAQHAQVRRIRIDSRQILFLPSLRNSPSRELGRHLAGRNGQPADPWRLYR